MKSHLNGTIISDYKQNTSMVFVDMSVYNEILPIQQATLTVFTPYASNPIEFFYNVKGNTVITSILLDRSSELDQLPCGLYKFKQSICPNDKLFYEFWYVHLGKTKQKLADLYCSGRIKEAMELDTKINALEAFTYCIDDSSEAKILAMLDSIDCEEKLCTNKQPMQKIINMIHRVDKQCGCKSKCTCKAKPVNPCHSCN